MKKKRMGLGLVLLAVLAFWGGYSIAAEGGGLRAPAGEITIEGKKPAAFKHDVHSSLGVECGQCHHDATHQPRSAEAIGAMTDPGELRCASCHNDTFANQDLRQRKDIFHARCKECHQSGYNDKKGPTKCSACHVQKKRKAVEGC